MLRALVGLCILGLFIFPAVAQDKKKSAADVDKDDATKAVTESKKKLVAGGKIAGKLIQVEGTTKFLTLQVTAKVTVPNLEAMRNAATQQANFRQQLADASREANPVNRQRRIAQIQLEMAKQQANQGSMYQVKEHNHKIEFQAADDVKVRTYGLPVEYDDKGKPRKYTPKELAELKGNDPKLPGYTAEYDSLRPGQEVEITFLRPKAAPKPRIKDTDRELVAQEERLKATLIVIYRDAPAK